MSWQHRYSCELQSFNVDQPSQWFLRTWRCSYYLCCEKKLNLLLILKSFVINIDVLLGAKRTGHDGNKLEQVVDQYSLTPDRTYNVDETGGSTVPKSQ
nr:unnamed protein product [Callosobruchus analis]